MSKKADGLIPFFILAILAFIWGSSFILMKIGLNSLAPVELASLRVAIAGISLSPFAISAIHKHRAKWKALLGVGLLGNLLPAILFANAQTVIDSSLSGMLNSLTAVFTLLFGVWFFGIVASRRKWLGVLIALIGSSLLFAEDLIGGDLGQIQYGGLVLLATCCYGVSVNVIRNYLSGVKSIEVAALSLLPVSIISFIIYLYVGDFNVLSSIDGQQSIGAVVLLAISGTAFASVLFFYLVSKTSALFASMVTYLIPLVAILWGLLVGEEIQVFEIMGMLVIFLGILLIRR